MTRVFENTFDRTDRLGREHKMVLSRNGATGDVWQVNPDTGKITGVFTEGADKKTWTSLNGKRTFTAADGKIGHGIDSSHMKHHDWQFDNQTIASA